MNRRRFMQFSTAGSVLGASFASADESKEATKSLAIGPPVVMAPRTDGVEIVWRVSGLAKGFVEFGATMEPGEVASNDGWGLRPAGGEVIRVRLDGLEAGTRYFYRVVTEDFARKNPKREAGEIRSFKTLSAEAAETSFSVWNDTHKHDETIRRLASMTPPGDFLLWNGDISNDWYKEGEVAETLVSPAGVDFTADNPLVFVRGNHDLRGNFAYQMEDFAATPEGNPWTAFRSGPLAAIVMDTGEDKADDNPYLFGRVACEPMREEQAKWLAEVIERPEIKNAPYRVMFCHIPLRWTDEKTKRSYDNYSLRSRKLWHESLVKWGAQVIVSGHMHKDAFIGPDAGFPYAQLVGGGPKMPDARLITGKADGKELVLSMTDMDGKEVRRHGFEPLV